MLRRIAPLSLLVMEQTDSRKAHRNTMLVAGFNDLSVTDRSTRLCDILHAASECTLNIIAEWEERIGAKRYISCLGKPCLASPLL